MYDIICILSIPRIKACFRVLITHYYVYTFLEILLKLVVKRGGNYQILI